MCTTRRKAGAKRRGLDATHDGDYRVPDRALLTSDGFDPDEMFKDQKTDTQSEESVTADDVYLKPVVYAYDAYQEKLDKEAREAAALARAQLSAMPVAAVPAR